MLEDERGGRKSLRKEPDTEKEGLATSFNVRDFFLNFVLFSASLQQSPSILQVHAPLPLSRSVFVLFATMFGPGYH